MLKRILLVISLCALGACASVSKTVTGPGGYGYSEKIMASGRSNIEAAAQQFGGSLLIDSPDGLHVEAELDSQADATGVTSDNAAELLAGFINTLQAILSLAGKTP